MSKAKKITLIVLVAIVLMQFVQIDKTNPVAAPQNDFIAATAPTTEVENVLKSACYDCHSNNSVYPWYTYVSPVSWWIKQHINEAREELNFSEWTSYSAKKADHKLEECIEMVKEEEMPLPSYTWMHPEAKISQEQRVLLTDFFASLRK